MKNKKGNRIVLYTAIEKLMIVEYTLSNLQAVYMSASVEYIQLDYALKIIRESIIQLHITLPNNNHEPKI